MAVTGAKPKPEGQKVTRVQPVHDWVEVLDIPYTGDRPNPGRLPKVTQEWWDDVTTMPHCILWTPADWRFAIDTARVHALAFRPKGRPSLIAEVRTREKVLATTSDARRDQRIRYVQPVQESAVDAETNERVADFESERRRRLLEA